MSLARSIYRRINGRRIRLLREEVQQRKKGTSITNIEGVRIFFDASDRRGRWLYEGGGAFDTNALRLWRRIVAEHQPDIAIDIGANYGEIGLGARYPNHCSVHLIEANPRLIKYLRRSAKAVAESHVHSVAASNETGSVDLYRMGSLSSGFSSIVGLDHAESVISVPARRVDDIVAFQPKSRVCFKIDVEGAEVQVLMGMKSILDDTDWIGMVEFVHLKPAEVQWLRFKFRHKSLCIRSGDLLPFPESNSLDEEAAAAIRISRDALLRPL